MSYIKNHNKPYFLNSTFPPTFQTGSKNVSALLVPHAGSAFVKEILDFAFDKIDISPFNKVILLTTNHSTRDNFQMDNPIQKIKLNKINGIRVDSSFFRYEHSYLSILPYLEKIGYPCSIIAVGEFSPELVRLIEADMDGALLIVNTDLLHCGPNYGIECPANPKKTNLTVIRKIISGKKIFPKEMCGFPAVRLFLEIIRRLNYQYTEYIYTSSDIQSNNRTNSVGYAGILFDKNEPNLEYYKQFQSLPKMTLESFLRRNGATEPSHKLSVFIRDVEGIFTTIYKDGKLRGCIGTFNLLGDLNETISNRTITSASKDGRFAPIKKSELPRLTYKINFLKMPVVSGINKMNVGKHGITIHFRDGQSATYLASVLPESFGIDSKKKLMDRFNNIRDSLQEKSGASTRNIDFIEIYECVEI
jgi:uncharacterized protein (TIGR00296 family)/AmmeMemoRadiSam system protein B